MCLLPALLVLSVLIVKKWSSALNNWRSSCILGLQSNALVMLFWESFRREKALILFCHFSFFMAETHFPSAFGDQSQHLSHYFGLLTNEFEKVFSCSVNFDLSI